MLLGHSMPVIARRLERELARELRIYDNALADVRWIPDADRLGATFDLLSAWAAVPEDLTGDTAESSETVATADAFYRGVGYFDAITGWTGTRQPIMHPCSLRAVVDGHFICCPPTVHHDGVPVHARPGTWRRWAAQPDDHSRSDNPITSDPTRIPQLMTRWERSFGDPGRWRGRHPLIHAALAWAALANVSPFADANQRMAQLVGHGILRYAGVPITCILAARGHYNAQLADALATARRAGDLLPWCQTVVAAVTDVMRQAPVTLSRIREITDGMAVSVPAFPAYFTLGRRELNLALIERPVQRPAVFARRQGLGRSAAERVLRSLLDAGYIDVVRLDGRQDIVTRPALTLIGDLRAWPSCVAA